MRSLLLIVFSLTFGFMIGWHSYPRLNHHDPRHNSLDSLHNNTLNSATNIADVKATRQQSDKLNQNDTPNSNSLQQNELDNLNINLLKEFNLWSSYDNWLDAFNMILPHSSKMYLLKANAAISLANNYQEALEAYTLAIEVAASFTLSERYSQLRNTFLKNTFNEWHSGTLEISAQEYWFFLEFAFEKQPGFPPIHIAMAKFLAEQSRFVEALERLDAATVNTQFDSQMEKLRDELKRDQLNQLNAKTGIPLEPLGQQFIVNVTINDNFPLRLLIDTGASSSVLGISATENLLRSSSNSLIDTGRRALIATANGNTTARVFEIESLSINGFKLENALIYEANIGNEAYFDGLLGMDFLAQFNFRIDQSTNLLYLQTNPNE